MARRGRRGCAHRSGFRRRCRAGRRIRPRNWSSENRPLPCPTPAIATHAEKDESEDRLDIRGDCGRDTTGTAGGTARSLNLSENYLSQRAERDFRFGSFHEETASDSTSRHVLVEPWESDMMSEMQIHTIARQMMEKHGLT